jgi:hypothetical protein
MANSEHVEIVRGGAEAIRKWRNKNPHVRLDLDRAILSKTDLNHANLGEATLQEADLTEANLSDANIARALLYGTKLRKASLPLACLSKSHLYGADLSGANLSGADLYEADLRNANLSGADLGGASVTGAILCEANLKQTNLSGSTFIDVDISQADFSDAIIDATVFANVDLSSATSLDAVRHRGPSTIGVDTLFRSRGRIPEGFLKGCGIPDVLITYLPSLMSTRDPVQFYSCFISYSHSDEAFCKRLYSRMRDEHLRVWYAPEDIMAGRKLHEQIEQAIRVYDKVLLVLSETSLQSDWVATEIYHARQREVKEKRRVLFPIRLVPFEMIRQWQCFDADSGKDMAREIREYFIPEFSNWKDHDSFEAAFKRLLDDLKATS